MFRDSNNYINNLQDNKIYLLGLVHSGIILESTRILIVCEIKLLVFLTG